MTRWGGIKETRSVGVGKAINKNPQTTFGFGGLNIKGKRITFCDAGG